MTLDHYKSRDRFRVVIAGVWAGEIPEETAMVLLGVDLLEIRESVAELRDVTESLLTRFKEYGKTVEDDLQDEWREGKSGLCSACSKEANMP